MSHVDMFQQVMLVSLKILNYEIGLYDTSLVKQLFSNM